MDLRRKDERKDWSKISYKVLSRCGSSPSFFDAKGMLFHIPLMIIFDLSSDLHNYPADYPDAKFHLTYDLDDDYQKNKFSLIKGSYAQCVVDFLEIKSKQVKADYLNYIGNFENDDFLEYCEDYIELQDAIAFWKDKAALI